MKYIFNLFFLAVLWSALAVLAYELRMNRQAADRTRIECLKSLGSRMTESSKTGLLGRYSVLCERPIVTPPPFRIKPEKPTT